MSADISEKGLETLIIQHMTGVDGLVFAVTEHSRKRRIRWQRRKPPATAGSLEIPKTSTAPTRSMCRSFSNSCKARSRRCSRKSAWPITRMQKTSRG
jgi:hypothetical protein